jgi:DNA-directed RNA polymerase subunit M/transcription elongation factor TFIIS
MRNADEGMFECFECGAETPTDEAVFENRVYEAEVAVDPSPYHHMDPRHTPTTETRPAGTGRVPVCPDCSREDHAET